MQSQNAKSCALLSSWYNKCRQPETDADIEKQFQLL
ncbi:hypothetical protein CLOBOL_07290 [Enterocloster bolteae ATCC BAA-613]|uniref:Uncharacterized protein n=1 Tax=Enterocloster bolteae (strain ATCC BAA-613 / DSM 15670 / CCUG 46953 / JCM 12243 / WAL 16351) TaxID=411902 RepID=A8S5R2_ENTBW|nr:hypothetical protein CLOBOL_07290 [Enterocloster bolteae ATCC BAA-613]